MSEEAFQRLLDENIEDHECRMVFGDWLDDHDDPRGPGYRALGETRSYPWVPDQQKDSLRFWFWYRDSTPGVNCCNHIAYHGGLSSYKWQLEYMRIIDAGHDLRNGKDSSGITRRRAEDAAALAWLEVEPEERIKTLERASNYARELSRSKSGGYTDSERTTEEIGSTTNDEL